MKNAAPDTRLWEFAAFDSWFFRESRPFDSVGYAQLASHFPPPARTLAGAVRTAIGEGLDVDWARYNNSDSAYKELREQMGDAKGLGRLQLSGPYLLQNGEPLFPAPLLLLQKGTDQQKDLVRLLPGEDVTDCDLGRVRLPRLAEPSPGASPLENAWLTRAGLEKVLAGVLPDLNADVRVDKALFGGEERLGIGRDNRKRTNVEGLLYQTRHIRPLEKVTLGVQVSGLAQEFCPADGAVRLGGEGRFSAFSVRQSEDFALAAPPLTANKLMLILLTPTDFNGDWKPEGFDEEETDDSGAQMWRGYLDGIGLRIVSAIIGKAVREGGWDMAGRQPRPLRSLVPAGSCYFCEFDGDANEVRERLHHCNIGLETELGRGEVVVGCW